MSSKHPTDHVSSGGQPEPRGLRSAVAALCRAALRDVESDESRQHVAGCSFCMARTKAVDSIKAFASQRPEVPAALKTTSLLSSVYERIAESPQHVSLGEWLEQSPVPVPEGTSSQGSEEASPWAEAVVGVEHANRDLLGELVRGPELPDARVWSGVRRSILANVARASAAPTRIKLRNWRILLAGAAAAAVIGLLTVSDSSPEHPVIVFADLDRAPDVPFATVRYGSRH